MQKHFQKFVAKKQLHRKMCRNFAMNKTLMLETSNKIISSCYLNETWQLEYSSPSQRLAQVIHGSQKTTSWNSHIFSKSQGCNIYQLNAYCT